MPKLRADLELEGGARITGLPAAAAPGEPVTFEQLGSGGSASAGDAGTLLFYLAL